jgi:hypothetical protein
MIENSAYYHLMSRFARHDGKALPEGGGVSGGSASIVLGRVSSAFSRRESTLLTVCFSLRRGDRYSASKSRRGRHLTIGKQGKILKYRPLRDFRDALSCSVRKLKHTVNKVLSPAGQGNAQNNVERSETSPDNTRFVPPLTSLMGIVMSSEARHLLTILASFRP